MKHSGELLLPSRLLLQCREEELAARVELLFCGALVDEPPPPPEAVPPFVPRRVKPPSRMRITSFKSYLECPFSFYLERVLELRARNPEAAELDAMGYGSLAHAVLQECVPFQSLEAPRLEAAAQHALERCRRKCFGAAPPGLVLLQCELLSGTLPYFAAAQEREYAAGWRIMAGELAVGTPWSGLFRRIFPAAAQEPWRDGVILSGRIDRIDRRKGPDGGVEVRVLDYKTNASADLPARAHLCTSVPEEQRSFRMAESCRDGRGRELFWRDLQLPLYVLLLRHCLAEQLEIPPSARIGAGYFNLPLELTATGVDMFPELEDPLTLESAARCADAVLRRIYIEEVFWPPAKQRLELFDGCELETARFMDPGGAPEKGGRR